MGMSRSTAFFVFAVSTFPGLREFHRRRLPPAELGLDFCKVSFPTVSQLVDYLAAKSSFATATTRSGSKPNFFCNSLSGAEAPKVCMPTTRPFSPT